MPLGPLQLVLHLCPKLDAQRPARWTHAPSVWEQNSQDPEGAVSRISVLETEPLPPQALPGLSLELRASTDERPREAQRVFSELELMSGWWDGGNARVFKTGSTIFSGAVSNTSSELALDGASDGACDEFLEPIPASHPQAAPEPASGDRTPPANPPEAPHQSSQPFSQLIASSCELRLQHQAEPGKEPGSSESSEFSAIGSCLPTPAALSRALRFATQPSLLSQGLVLLHASSVCINGQGHLFAAPSGTGKSTLARRLVRAGAELLGDEVALVGWGRIWVHPGQLEHGTLGQSAPLAAIHLLRQGPLKIHKLRPAQGLAELLSLCMSYIDGPNTTQKLVDLMSGWLQSCPVYESSVPNSDEALGLLSLLETAGIKA